MIHPSLVDLSRLISVLEACKREAEAIEQPQAVLSIWDAIDDLRERQQADIDSQLEAARELALERGRSLEPYDAPTTGRL